MIPQGSKVTMIKTTTRRRRKRRNVPGGGQRTCPWCHKTTQNHSEFEYHLLSAHIGEKCLKCPQCPKFFFRPHQLKDHHIKILHIEEEFKRCPTCGKSVLAHRLAAHKKRLHCSIEERRQMEATCPICLKKLSSRDSLRGHMLTHSGQKSWFCLWCEDRSFRTKSELNDHLLRHTKERLYRCDLCSKSFGLSGNLRVHQRRHEGMEFPCPGKSCSKKATSLSSLLSHLKRSPECNPKPKNALRHDCPLCTKSFLTSQELQLHKRVHTREKPFFCSFCSRAFGSSCNLTRHMRLHCGERSRPHKCSLCPKAFMTASELRRHAGKHVDQVSPCLTCDKEYKSPFHLKLHMRHCSRIRRHGCSLCFKKFRTTCALKEHAVVHTRERAHVCSVCSEAFTNGSNLRRHVVSKHLLSCG